MDGPGAVAHRRIKDVANAKDIEISKPSELKDVLRIFSAFDDARWSDHGWSEDDIRWKEGGNYNLINHCEEDFSCDEKLLIHWLTYITDRQKVAVGLAENRSLAEQRTQNENPRDPLFHSSSPLVP